MRTFGLIGYPLSHSFSQKYFTEKFLAENISGCEYRNFPLQDIGSFSALLSSNPTLSGINVTIPYKQQVTAFLDDADEVVSATGACNCIAIKEGRLKGYNTDVTGFERSLQRKLQKHHTQALVLGTGGASRAVEYVLSNLHIAYLKVSRTPDDHSNCIAYLQVDQEMIRKYPLIINTTPLGMYPNVDAYPQLPYEAMTAENYLFDLVYNPEKTVFLQKGELRDAAIMNGYDMLKIQAEESWRIWNGR